MTDWMLVLAGIAAFPVLAFAGYYGWRGLRAANRWLRLYFNELRLDKVTKRAHFGAVAASSRRIWAIPLPGSAAIVIAAGIHHHDKEPAYRALLPVLTQGEDDRPKPARINPKWLRRGQPTEPTVTFDEED
ncbi:hypothetical protein [Catenuloplanes japonicus]|uniref:hypothetical protein n=1 Tax=Catenuloplanes japonicus TaxID=33876 RepID=UPI000525D81D|nr:hypothetical protein [Catenuloplanes japonicus]